MTTKVCGVELVKRNWDYWGKRALKGVGSPVVVGGGETARKGWEGVCSRRGRGVGIRQSAGEGR